MDQTPINVLFSLKKDLNQGVVAWTIHIILVIYIVNVNRYFIHAFIRKQTEI